MKQSTKRINAITKIIGRSVGAMNGWHFSEQGAEGLCRKAARLTLAYLKRESRKAPKKPTWEIPESAGCVGCKKNTCGSCDEMIVTAFMLRREFVETGSAGVATFDLVAGTAYEAERWAVRMGRECLTRKGTWEFEPQPSSRTKEFYERCRFPNLPEAVHTYVKAREKGSRK